MQHNTRAHHPFDSVRMMGRIAAHTEASLDYAKILDEKARKSGEGNLSVTGAIGEATCDISQDLQCAAILAATATGKTALVVSKYRPRAAIIAPTHRKQTYYRLGLVWGVVPTLVEVADDADSMMEVCIDAATRTGLVTHDDLVVITGGVPVGKSGSTNFIKVHRIGQPLRPL